MSPEREPPARLALPHTQAPGHPPRLNLGDRSYMQCRVPLLALWAAHWGAAIPLVDRWGRPQTAPRPSCSPALPSASPALPSHFFLSPSHLPFWGKGVLQLKRKFPSSSMGGRLQGRSSGTSGWKLWASLRNPALTAAWRCARHPASRAASSGLSASQTIKEKRKEKKNLFNYLGCPRCLGP